MNKKIVCRCDASAHIGMGHLSRLLVLCSYLKGYEWHIATLYPITIQLPFNITTHLLANSHIDHFITLAKVLQADAIVIDHYGVHSDQQQLIKQAIKAHNQHNNNDIPLIVFDDDYQTHCADVIINPNLYADATQYPTDEHTTILAGSSWLLIKEHLSPMVRQSTVTHIKEATILSVMGASDAKEINRGIIEQLSPLVKALHIATTSYNSQVKVLQDKADQYDNSMVHVDKDLSPLFTACDIAVITPSVIACEAISWCKLFVAIMVADNQQHFANYLHNRGIVVLQQGELTQLPQALQTTLQHKEQLMHKMATLRINENITGEMTSRADNYQRFFAKLLYS